MTAVIESTENSQVTLKVEVEPERLAKATDRAYQRLVQRVSIPGFRKGKAPRRILERTVGVDTLYREALDFVMPAAYEEAVKESNIVPYARPEFEVVQLEPEKALVFKAVVPVQPTVKLGDYRSIRVEAGSFGVTEEDVDKALQDVRASHGQWVPVEGRPLHIGDQAALDVLTSLDGRQLSESPREIVAELGTDAPLPSWANALAGLSVGEEKDIVEPIPDDYRDASLAGKTATYHVVVKSIKQRELPDLDDELARTVGDYDDLEALKQDLRKRLEAQRKSDAKETFESEVVDKLVEISEIEFPAVMVDHELDHMLQEAESSFRRQGFSLEMFLRGSRKSVDELRGEWHPRAVRRIKSGLVLNELIEAEKLELSEGELDGELTRMVEGTSAERRESVRKLVESPKVRESVVHELLLRKAMDVLDRAAGGSQFVELEESR